MSRPAIDSVLSLSPHPQILFDVKDGGALIAVVASRAAYASGLLIADAVEGRTVEQVLRPECAHSLRAGYRDALRLGSPATYEEFAVVGEKETWWMTTVSPELDEQECPSRLLVSFLALDFVQRTESLLRRSEANFRALIEGLPDATFVADPASRLLYANPAASRWLERDPANLYGVDLAEILADVHGSGAKVQIVRLPVVFDMRQATLIVLRDLQTSGSEEANAPTKVAALTSLASGKGR